MFIMITIYHLPRAHYIGMSFHLFVRACVCVLPREIASLLFIHDKLGPVDAENSH